MDLTKLYNFTTAELREEAERLGVRDTYALSRAQLIHAIRAQVNGDQSSGLFGRVLGFAKRALQQGAQQTLEVDRQSRPPPPSSDSAREAPASASAAEPEPEPAVAAPTVRSEVPSLFRAPASSAPPASASAGPSSRAPVGVFSSSASRFEEPFPTRTMARILADQGHYKRSLAIYADLIRQAPDDAELQGEAERVRTQSRSRRPHA
ncbi:MAG: hypothetical protein AAF500_22565 [Myxococcota bacterium]